MPLPKLRAGQLAATLLGGCLLTAAAQTGETVVPTEPAAPLAFVARVESGEFIGTEQLRRMYVSVGTNQLGFVVPEGLRVDVSRADRITLAQSDLSFFLTVRIVANAASANDTLREQALAHYPGALLVEETNLEAAGQRGPMFNLRWKPTGGVDRMVTMAFLPTTAGVLELDLVADQAKFTEAQNALSGLLCRLQSCSGGKLRMETFRQPEHN